MITARVNTADVDEGFKGLMRRGRNVRPVTREVAKLLRADLKDHFVGRQGIDGGWPGYAPSTAKKLVGTKKTTRFIGPMQPGERRRVRTRRYYWTKRGGITKRGIRRMGNMLGRLRTAIKMETGPRWIRAEAIPEWAGVHEFGGRGNRNARIPSRSFMWASDSVVEVFRSRVLDHVANGWKGGRS